MGAREGEWDPCLLSYWGKEHMTYLPVACDGHRTLPLENPGPVQGIEKV